MHCTSCGEDGDDAETYRYWLKSIGNPKEEQEALDALSPRHRAAEVNIPVLLMHGTDDGIVPARQSELMHKALEKAGKSAQYLPFTGEPHSRWSMKNEIRQIEAAIEFLKPMLD